MAIVMMIMMIGLMKWKGGDKRDSEKEKRRWGYRVRIVGKRE